MLTVENLSVRAKLDKGYNIVSGPLSFSLGSGGRLAITGGSGAGKTMAALSLIGLLPDNCKAYGLASLEGENLLKMGERELKGLRGKEIAYMPQSGAECLNPIMTVGKHLEETLKHLGRPRGVRREEAYMLLKKAGFENFKEIASKYPFQLSGGMAQRVIVSLALASRPKLLIADEPTRGLHSEAALGIMDLLMESFPESAVIVITHDKAVALRCGTVLEASKHA